MNSSTMTRRSFLTGTALATAVIAAPWVRTSHAAGKLALGLWDHWVPGANDVLRKTIIEWAKKNRVEIQLDFITSIGGKNLLTAQAEAQAKTGHDVMAHPTWQVSVHRALLEPVDDVVGAFAKKYGAPNSTVEFLGKHDEHWLAIPTTIGSQVKPCCSRLDLYKHHAGIDLQKIFPADDKRDKALTDRWTWDTYLSSAEKLFKAGYPIGNPLGQTSDAVDWVGALFRSYGVVAVDGKDTIKLNSPETRAALEYAKRLTAVMPKEVYAKELDEAALIDGAGQLRMLLTIFIPVALPGIIAATIFAFTVSWGAFLYPMAFIYSTDQLVLTAGIVTTLIKGDVFQWGSIMAGALLAAAPPVVIYAFLMDYYIAGLTAGATKG